MRTTSFEKFAGSLQKMSSQESIAPTMLSTLLWHQIMFKTVANKRSFLTSLVAGHTQSFVRNITKSAGCSKHILVVQAVLCEDRIVAMAPCCFSCNGGWCGSLAWLLLPRHRLKRTTWTHVYWHSHAKLSEARPRMSTDTCAQDRPNGYGNNSSWSQQMWLWQCSDCYGGNKLLVILHPHGRFCLPFLAASLVCQTLWTIVERVSDVQRLNNVLQLDDLDDAVACPAKLFTDAEVKETFLYADVHVLVAEWSTERIPPPNVPRDEHVLLPPVVEREVELPFVCEQALQDGTLCPAAFPTKIALAAHQTHFKKHARGVKRCVASALVCGNQCCNCGAVLASRTCLRTHLKDSVRRGFCRASLAKGSPTQRIVEFSPMSCSLCGAQLSENGAALAHMTAHLRTFSPAW